MKKINLRTTHPIADIRSNMVFANNGNVILCYVGTLPEIYSLSSTDFEDLHGTWFQAMKSLPVGTVVHKQDVYTKQSYSPELLPSNTFLARATFEHFKGRGFIDHHSYLFFILTGSRTLNNPKYVNPFQKVAKEIPSVLDAAAKNFMNSVNDSVSLINNS